MLLDKLICKFRALYYRIYETIRLQLKRHFHKYDMRVYGYFHGYFGEKLKWVEPFITVYTPTYNRAVLLLDRAMRSVLNQTHKNFEYIIVDDGSVDNTEELVKSIDDKRIRYYKIKRKRPHHNYDSEKEWHLSASYPANYALKKAKGQWIAKIDDDDIWTNDHLEKLLRFAQEGNYEFVSSQYEHKRYGKRKIFGGAYFKSPYFFPKRKGIDLDSPRIGGHSSWFYRSYLKFMKYNTQAWRKNWNRVDFADLSLRMFKAGVRMGFLEEITLYVLPRPGEETIGLDAIIKRKYKEEKK